MEEQSQLKKRAINTLKLNRVFNKKDNTCTSLTFSLDRLFIILSYFHIALSKFDYSIVSTNCTVSLEDMSINDNNRKHKKNNF